MTVPKLDGVSSQAFLASAALTGTDAIATLMQLLRARLVQRQRGGAVLGETQS